MDAAKGGQIQPLYSVMGVAELTEANANALAGYRRMGPVRVGNAAYQQIQHDCYGQIVLPTVQGFIDQRLLRVSDDRDFESLEQVGEMADQRGDVVVARQQTQRPMLRVRPERLRLLTQKER